MVVFRFICLVMDVGMCIELVVLVFSVSRVLFCISEMFVFVLDLFGMWCLWGD